MKNLKSINLTEYDVKTNIIEAINNLMGFESLDNIKCKKASIQQNLISKILESYWAVLTFKE